MEASTTLAIVIVVFALIVVAVILAFRKQIAIAIKGPAGSSLEVSASNEPTRPPEPGPKAVIRESSSAEGGARAEDRTGDGALIEHVQARGDLQASSAPPDGVAADGATGAERRAAAVSGSQAGRDIYAVAGDLYIGPPATPAAQPAAEAAQHGIPARHGTPARHGAPAASTPGEIVQARIAALQRDIALEMDGERKVVLRRRLAELEADLAEMETRQEPPKPAGPAGTPPSAC
ncbi:MAG: hypothetical protein JXM73_14265 [Anaerolineae bacterium]|nr:hypothetical protein [Anaerolineae bacterium]